MNDDHEMIAPDPTDQKAAPLTRRATLHLLQDVEAAVADMREALNLKYEEEHDFTIKEVNVGSIEGLLYTGVIGGGRPPEWGEAVHLLTGVRPTVENRTAAGVLLIPVEGEVFAITYGMGHLLLDHSHVTSGFGFGFALRTLKPDAVRQVTHSMMDARGRTDRKSAAQDQHIRAFAIEEYGEVVSRLAGKLGDISLTLSKGRKRPVQIAGTDALKIHLGSAPGELLSDLAEINRITAQVSPEPAFDVIARVRRLKTGDGRKIELDRRLDELLGDPSRGSIALTAPTGCLDEADSAASHWVKIGPRRESVHDLDLDHVLMKTQSLPAGKRLTAMIKGHIQLCRDEAGREPASTKIPAQKWLVAEMALGTSRFFYHEGHWYEVGDRHLESMREQVHELLSASAGVSLIDWTADLKDEGAYNRAAADAGGFVCMDRKLINTEQHPRGFESCDLFGMENELIHVKRAESTAPLNHLFAQGRVSADALRLDSSARQKFLRRVRAEDSGHPVKDDFVPKKVIYAISLKSGKPLTVDNLFTFAQVSLLQAASALRSVGIEVAVVNIPTVP
ncbi:TIGR04141 family sporadically distributed protein [Streptosporangium sp. NBC_01755]|uniref:DUF6119 family protein n=1 Tax=Streptosporangium sp. NBC_01755 TaxID=2975949 RepID=UPI002DDC8899|nr:DUF6119 family protein [Streptosporangium sp. NBC_01755]WSD00167.1 TIGR04141 family sporadically distributed protein [Streptosporangium sp. NBC_01755]